jgi:hypothetical protein
MGALRELNNRAGQAVASAVLSGENERTIAACAEASALYRPHSLRRSTLQTDVTRVVIAA